MSPFWQHCLFPKHLLPGVFLENDDTGDADVAVAAVVVVVVDGCAFDSVTCQLMPFLLLPSELPRVWIRTP